MQHLTSEKTLKVFSSEGRLNQVGTYRCLYYRIRLQGCDCLWIDGSSSPWDRLCGSLRTKKGPGTFSLTAQDKLIDPATVTSFYKVTNTIGCVMLGYQGDNKSLIQRLRYEASNFKYENGYDIPVHVLAGKLSSFEQLISQYAAYRTFCTSMVL